MQPKVRVAGTFQGAARCILSRKCARVNTNLLNCGSLHWHSSVWGICKTPNPMSPEVRKEFLLQCTEDRREVGGFWGNLSSHGRAACEVLFPLLPGDEQISSSNQPRTAKDEQTEESIVHLQVSLWGAATSSPKRRSVSRTCQKEIK